MKKINLRWLLSPLLMGLILLGCSDTMTEPPSTEARPPFEKGLSSLSTKEVNPESVNDALETLAMALARALTERDVRIKLKEEVGKKFDGDYDVLFKNIADFRFTDGATFREKLAKGYAQARAVAGERVDHAAALASVNALAARIPKFHIIAVNYEIWDAGTYVPMVGYAPVNTDEILVERVKAFDENGNLLWLDNKKLPDFPVLGVGINERTDDAGNVNVMKLPSDEGGGGGGGGGSYPQVHLTVIWFRCMNANWDGLFGGGPEFYIAAKYGFGDWIHTDFYDVTSVGYYNVNRVIIRTTPPIYGYTTIRLMESDGGFLGGDDLVEDRWRYPTPTSSASTSFWFSGFEYWYYGNNNNADLSIKWVSVGY